MFTVKMLSKTLIKYNVNEFFAKSLSNKNINFYNVLLRLHNPNNFIRQINNLPVESNKNNSDFEENKNLLKPCTEDISHFVPNLRPTFNFAAYVDKSYTLQELVKLGVNLYKLEKRKNVPEFLLGLDFENDIKKYIIFLHDCGISSDKLGSFLTKNPFILKEDLDYLKVRIEYLKEKKFSPCMISKVIDKNPYWLLFSTERIDRRLGYFQKTFTLNGREVRKIAINQPRLITYNMETIRLNTFALKDEMGFQKEEIKALLLKRPKLWMIDQSNILKRFSFVHNQMKISHEMIVKQPEVLYCRQSRLQERHSFLVKLNRAQYNPKMENYVSLRDLVSGNDADFCINIAKSTPTTFNAFLKTL